MNVNNTNSNGNGNCKVIEEFRAYLKEKNLYFDDNVIKAIMIAPRKNFLLRGVAGTGKTTLATEYANFVNAEIVFFQCTQNTCEDDLLYKYVPTQNSKSGIDVALGPIPLALQLSKRKKVVLIIDEFDKTRASADALLLDVLQNYRVSLYLNDKKQIITAKAENLTVFLTSNDMREFSEPLLRRLVTLYLKPLPSSLVLNIMKKEFNDKIAVLLTQIYDDTIKANLRKPATIQELTEMGKMIEQDSNISLDDLIKMFIVKYEDDLQRFKMYVSNREAYVLNNNGNGNGKTELAQHYVAKKEIIIDERKEEKNENKTNMNTILNSIKVKNVIKEIEQIETIENETEVYAKIKDNDRDAYTKVIKVFRPDASDDPTRLGKFKLVIDKDNYIVADKMLNFRETYMIAVKTKGEFYAEDEFVLYDTVIDEIISKADKIRYYTKDVIACECAESKFLVEIKSRFVDFVYIKVKAYINTLNRDNSVDNVTDYLYRTYDDCHSHYSSSRRFCEMFLKRYVMYYDILVQDFPYEKVFSFIDNDSDNLEFINFEVVTKNSEILLSENIENLKCVLKVLKNLLKMREKYKIIFYYNFYREEKLIKVTYVSAKNARKKNPSENGYFYADLCGGLFSLLEMKKDVENKHTNDIVDDEMIQKIIERLEKIIKEGGK